MAEPDIDGAELEERDCEVRVGVHGLQEPALALATLPEVQVDLADVEVGLRQ